MVLSFVFCVNKIDNTDIIMCIIIQKKQSFLAATEWSCTPGDPGHLCTKQAHRASAMQQHTS